MYNLAVFTSSFLYASIKVGTVVMDIIIIGIIACGGRDNKLKNKIY